MCPFYSRIPPTRSISNGGIYSWSIQLSAKLRLLPHRGKTDYWPRTPCPKDLLNDSVVFYPELLEYIGLSNVEQGFHDEPGLKSLTKLKFELQPHLALQQDLLSESAFSEKI